MGLEGYFLHDFFTAREFNDLEERLRRERFFERRRRDAQHRQIEETEDELGRVALLARSLAELCIAKGLITTDELRKQMLATDLEDGQGDGKLDPRVVMPGESKLADLDPIEPSPAKRPKKKRR